MPCLFNNITDFARDVALNSDNNKTPTQSDVLYWEFMYISREYVLLRVSTSSASEKQKIAGNDDGCEVAVTAAQLSSTSPHPAPRIHLERSAC